MMRIVVQMSRKLSFLWGDPCTLQIRPCRGVTITSARIFNIDWLKEHNLQYNMPTLFRIYVVCLCDGSVVRSILKGLSLPNRYHTIVKSFILAVTQSASKFSSTDQLHYFFSNFAIVGYEIVFYNPRMTDLVLSDLIKIHENEKLNK